MTISTVNGAYAVLALVANAIVFVVVAGFLATRASASWRASWSRLRDRAAPSCLPVAWIAGVLAICGSLFFQLGEHLEPCDLCWFQRVAMYPQSLILGIALFIGDRYMVKRYMIPLAVIGAGFSVLHITLPNLLSAFGIATFPGCTLSNPCTQQPITELGFITIPYMALSGFLLIITMLLLMREAPTAD